ncbi:AAA ATPase [Vibrio phage RYC]|nr:AAA ATPase [Vibrio phage RYC]
MILDGYPFKLNKGQLRFLESYISSDKHFALLGEGGSGKSVIIDVIKRYYQDEMVTCAMSGVANQNLFGGKGGNGTFHKVVSAPTQMATNDHLRSVNEVTSKIFATSDLIKHIVIDEAFMMNSDNLYVLLRRVARFNKKNKNRKERQIRILLVGDPLQLPPIISEMDEDYCFNRHGHHLMFRSRVWEELDPQVMILEEVMRQGCKVFKAALNVIRFGEKDRYAGVLKWLNQRVNYRADPKMFAVCMYNKKVNQTNERVLKANKGRKFKYHAKLEGKFDTKENGVDEYIELAEGMDCITLVNDPEGEYNNGSFCTIEHLTEEGAWCHFHHNDSKALVPLHEYKEYETYVKKDVTQDDGSVRDEQRREEVGKCTQIPLKMAAAFSVHRSQGRTFDKEGKLDMGEGFNKRGDFGTAALYVGLSRFTKVDYIHLPTPLNKKHIKVCQDSVDFWNETLERWKNG